LHVNHSPLTFRVHTIIYGPDLSMLTVMNAEVQNEILGTVDGLRNGRLVRIDNRFRR
jgi:hypothetical protein